MKSAPPPTATKRSPSSIRRESICIPVTSSAHGRAVSRPSGSITPSSSGITCAAPHSGDLAVVERHLPGRELLLGLGAAAGDHDDVAALRARERELDRGAPVELLLERRQRSSGYLRGDRFRILRTRVVRGEDRAIRELRDDPAHQRALAAVAVAAGAEDDDQPAFCRGRAPPGARSRASRACVRSRRSP